MAGGSDGSGNSQDPASESTPDAAAHVQNGHGWVAGLENQSLLERQPRPILGAVLDHGQGTVWVGLTIGILLTLGFHGYASFRSQTAMLDMLDWISESRKDMRDYFWSTYDIEPPHEEKKADKEEPPPPPPPPDPDPIPQPQVQAAKPLDDPYKDAPPPIAQANNQVVSDDPYASWATQQGTGTNNSGLSSSAGQHTGHAENLPGAANTGHPTAPAAPPPHEDKSKPAGIVGSTAWNCPFPAEADSDGRDSAVATIVVTVRADGSPQSVSVIADPGSGFGRAARQCALGRRYQAGFDRDGNATTATTPPIRVRFSR